MMKFFSTFISISFLIESVAGILGGEIVLHGTKPFTTGILETIDTTSPDNFIFCAGTLISPTHVLTSVSCTELKKAKFVSVGAYSLNGCDGDEIMVANVTTHPKYNRDTLRYDFAVLTLAKASKRTPVMLPKRHHSGIRTGTYATVMGWGVSSFPSEGMGSDGLRSLSQKLIKNKACRKALNLTTIDRTQVCAGGEDGKSPCYGDFGGPLINCNNVLIGLYSGGNSCGVEGSPSVYARVSSALAWINSVIKA